MNTPEPDERLALGLVESLFDHLPRSPFFVKDRSLRYVGANRAMLALCGLRDRAQIIGRTAAEFFPGATRARYEALDRQVMRTRMPVTDQLDLSVRMRGGPVWLLFARWPVLTAKGDIAGVAAVARNLDAPDRRHPNYERLAKVVDYMQASLHEPLAIADLTQQFHVSASQLKRDFLALFGVSPQRYLTKIRIDAALLMLKRGEPIAGIAQACGYADQSAFARRFKHALGISPSEYRRGRHFGD
jgi:PAS domain S-box-containing protein